jgi:hypothetical protein
MSKDFAAEVEALCKAAEARATSVFSEAVRMATEEARTQAGPGTDADAVRASARRKQRTDTAHIWFTSDKAVALNYGFTATNADGRKVPRPGRNFIGLTAQRWAQIVHEASQKIAK